MVFYLVPPSGNIPYQKLEDYALKRLRFLLRLMCCRTPEEVEESLQDASVVHQSDCLISGSSKDLVSHHMLRVALCDDADTRNFFISSELALFKLRLAEMNIEDWEHFFKKTERNLRHFLKTNSPSTDSFLSDLDFLLGILSQEFCSWHSASKQILLQSPSQRYLCVPFHLTLGLVARREVELSKGLALVLLPQIREVFAELFQRSMELAVHQARLQGPVAKRDPRIRRLVAVLKRAYRIETRAVHHMPSSFLRLELTSLWSQAEYFPPCMSVLLSTLKTRHRLAHYDRIQLTLFLKDLGLSLHEALLLWKHEYSKPPAPPADPGKRGWHGNERRYIYSVRHLYGLEGGRVDYRGHSCSSIQSRSLSYLECGGCPFSLNDETQKSETIVRERNFFKVSNLGQQKRFELACASYMKTRLKERQSRVKCVGKLKTETRCDNDGPSPTRKFKLAQVSALKTKETVKADDSCGSKQPETALSSLYSPVTIYNKTPSSVAITPSFAMPSPFGNHTSGGVSVLRTRNRKRLFRNLSEKHSYSHSLCNAVLDSTCKAGHSGIESPAGRNVERADGVNFSGVPSHLESMCYKTVHSGTANHAIANHAGCSVKADDSVTHLEKHCCQESTYSNHSTFSRNCGLESMCYKTVHSGTANHAIANLARCSEDASASPNSSTATLQFKRSNNQLSMNLSEKHSSSDSLKNQHVPEQGSPVRAEDALPRDEGSACDKDNGVGNSRPMEDWDSSDVDIRKPSDYYRCYITLLHSLKTVQ